MEPRWQALANELRADITSGELTGELPSESELGATHSLSRGTVRKALESLEAQGLITSAQGLKRRVRKGHRWRWPMHSWERQHSAAEDAWAAAVREQVGTPRTTVTVSVEPAGLEVATALGIAPGVAVAVRRRLRQVDDEPHQFADSYFPYDIAEANPVFLTPGDQSAPGGLLAQAGLTQVRFSDRIEARMPTPEEAQTLRLPAGVPLLVHHRTGFDADGRAVRHMLSRMGADRVEVTYEVGA